jgi:hypothetical protein
MRAARPFPWWAAVPVVAALTLGLAGLRLPDAPLPPSTARPAPVLTLVAAEGTAALDPTSLFMPRPNREGKAALRAEVPSVAAEFPPVLEAGSRPELRILPGGPAGPAALTLTERADAPLALERTDEEFARLPERLAEVQVLEARGWREVLRLKLPPSDEAGAPKGGWQPLELRGSVGLAGLEGGLVVSRSSGSADTDRYFRLRLTTRERVGERLAPGEYVIRVGP